MSIAELEFTVPLRVTMGVAGLRGLVMQAAGDPLHGEGAFVRYDLDGAAHFGYILTRLATEAHGRRWGMGLLYDVDPSASSEPPRPRRPLDRRFRQRAEIEFVYA